MFVIIAVKFIVTIENADKNILCDFGINENELKIDNKEIIAKLLLINVAVVIELYNCVLKQKL